MWSSWRVQAAFGLAIFSLLVVGGISLRGIAASSESDRWVRHTYQVLESLQSLRLAMESIQSSSGAFALTGSEPYRESLRAGIASARQEQANVRSLTVDNPRQQSRLPALDALASQEIQFEENVGDLRQKAGYEAAAAAVRSGTGQRIMDEFRQAVGEMRDEEQRLLTLRIADAGRSADDTNIILVLGTVLGLLIATAAGWSVQRDTARRALAEVALREGTERFSGLANNISQLAWMTDETGAIVWCNRRWLDYTGTTLAETAGWGWKKVLRPDHMQRVVDKITRCFQSGEVWEDTFPLRGRDGSYRWFLSSAVPIRDASGKVLRWFGTNTDISERMVGEVHLAQMEGRYRGLLEAAPDAMVVVNQGGDIVLLNVQAEKQFGYSRDELIGQKVKNIIPEGFAERLIADETRSADDALAQQIGTGIELSGRRRDGSEFPIEIMLSPLQSPEGVLVTAAIRDITARKQAEVTLLLKVEELNRSNEELGQFAYIASHDLQEPLRMVASYTQLLSRRYKGKLDADADEFISFAVDGASRMQRLIQDLLTFSRVGTKGHEVSEISSEDALQHALHNLSGALAESHAEVTHDPLPVVRADEMQLIQLFQNLVGNGIKYQSPGIPRVHVSATRLGSNKWSFSVRDNGLGIEAQYFERIFGMFQRLHKREEFAGTGMGLAICKKIVERHGGTISVASQPGQGSNFSFALNGSENEITKAKRE